MSWSSDTTQRRPARTGGAARVATVELLWGPNPEPADGRVRRALAPERPLVVGRQAEDGLTLRDGAASRTHATLTLSRREPRVAVVDSSANGTSLNGAPIDGAATAEDGDVLRMGDSFLLVRFVAGDQEDLAIEGLLGRAPTMRALRRNLGLFAPTDATVLILGETGTGKELVARALHARSGREGRFVAVNCAAIAVQLAESQLFGHVPGAFTGAKAAGEGFFRAADGGTLFLDEIGELPLALQPKLLRAIEERAVVPVGATEPVATDLRLIAATHQDLAAHVANGAFRGDLYARLAELVLETPPLRARREDILTILEPALGRPVADLDPDLVEALLTHAWPFNVRELVKVAKELVILGEGRELRLELVAARLAPTPPPEASEPPAARPAPREDKDPPDRARLEALLAEGGGSISHVARETGFSRRQVRRWVAEHGLDPDAFRK